MSRWVLQAVVSLFIMVALWMLFPMLELLETFLYAVFVPLLFIASLGLLTEAGVQGLWGMFSEATFERFRNKLRKYRHAMMEKA